ncbi:uncharacterized protein LOC113870193 [Abrus precatorius]|uniref:Uncharacterized protein LOC113870193 n=1 Tax=Abrus precatorius TaxID=3816 RepID=A0A8B8M611_ABRPR|nr:uncharacterized protein LOC113870193 [Abrus precatorius]
MGTMQFRGDVEWEQNIAESDDDDFEGDYESDEDSDDDSLDDDTNDKDSYLSNSVIDQHMFGAPSFMRALDLNAMIGLRSFESESNTFYCKCVNYDIDCEWLVRASLRKNKYFWKIKKYNRPHSCTRARISQNHRKFGAETIAECIKPMIESDPSFKIKLVISEVQARYGYTRTYRKAWMTKQKAIKNVFGQWEASYEALPQWCIAMCDVVRGSVVQLDVVQAYHNDNQVLDVQIFHRVFWSFGPCIRAFRHCKPLVQVDETHL